MFKRSRNRIILAIMGSVVLLFAATMSVILLASFRETRRSGRETLERYAAQLDPGQAPDAREERGPGRGPGDLPDGGGREFELSTFYCVALSEDGTVLRTDLGGRDVYEEEELADIAREILAEGRTSGRTGDLQYLVREGDGEILVVFLDDTVAEGGLRMMTRNVLIAGGAAIVVLFFLSLFLSKRIIRPLEENDQRQRRFISDAGHELKTPAAVIGANAEVLAAELGENEWLSNIRYETERMGELVGRLLDLSRAESARTPMEDTDLSGIVTGEALAFESLAYENGRTLRTGVEDGIRVSGDRTQLQQLVSVLLDNAVRHSSGGEISVSLGREGRSAVLRVENEGEIPQEKLGRLFDRFYRADEARSSEGDHYGLGLSIAKAVAERHGGTVRAACRDGKVEFTAVLPVRKQTGQGASGG